MLFFFFFFFTFTDPPSKGTSSAARDSAKETEKGKSNLPPDTSLWTVTEVVSFFSSLGFPEEAKSFQNQVRANSVNGRVKVSFGNVQMHDKNCALYILVHFLAIPFKTTMCNHQILRFKMT